MKKNHKPEIKSPGSIIFAIFLIFLLFATAALFVQAMGYDSSQSFSQGELYPIAIQGEYSEEGGQWMPFTKETAFDYHELRDITVRGHFTSEIPEGEKMFFNICQLWVKLRVNGREVFSFGPREGDGNPAQSIGNMWYTFVSPGITADDEVELSFGNLYRNAYFIQFDNLLWNMYGGSERALVTQAVNKDAGMLLMGGVFFVLTLFLFITGILLAGLKVRGALQFLWLGSCTLFSAAWFATLAPALSLFLPFPVSLNTLYAYSIQGIAASIILLVIESLSGWRRRAMYAALGVLMGAMFFAMGLQMKGVRDMFSTIDYFSMLDTVIALLLVFCLGYEIRVLKNNKLDSFLKAMLPLVVLGIMEMFNGIIQWSEAGICFGLGLFLFAVMEGFFILRRIRQGMESEKRASELERELSQSRTSILLSQIQPHFLYNSLVGIKQLCDDDPAKASDALEHFSYYLRGNLDSLSDTGLIPFSKELEHLEDYLYLEKMRYEDRIHVLWEIKCRDFCLPPLTLQPLVENAVRYGVTPRIEGGSLTVRSEEKENVVVITILDDGVGFDMEEKKEDDRTHIGIQNVRNRLETLCGGTLQMKSEKGAGTEVTITLPQRRNGSNEDLSS